MNCGESNRCHRFFTKKADYTIIRNVLTHLNLIIEIEIRISAINWLTVICKYTQKVIEMSRSEVFTHFDGTENQPPERKSNNIGIYFLCIRWSLKEKLIAIDRRSIINYGARELDNARERSMTIITLFI